MFSVNYRYQSTLGEIKYSEATPRSQFLGKTKGLALKYVCAGTENYLINNEPIAVSAGEFMFGMFTEATSFNSDVSTWNTCE